MANRDHLWMARAIGSAWLDRETLAAAYGDDDPHAKAARAEADAMRGLVGKRLKAMSPRQYQKAMLAFVYAEHHEGTYAARSRALAKRFREIQLRRWCEPVFDRITPQR